MKKINFEKIIKEQEKLNKNWIRVGMSTCGIAAGAEDVYEYLKKEIDKNALDIDLKKCGCLGACYAEPLVEINIEGLPRIIYGNVDKKVAARIIKEHVMGGRILDTGVYELKSAEL
ncbi:MAG: (2Fe-2S) ferredoxin domain-containing protein [Elusimicrobiota bacterium]